MNRVPQWGWISAGIEQGRPPAATNLNQRSEKAGGFYRQEDRHARSPSYYHPQEIRCREHRGDREGSAVAMAGVPHYNPSPMTIPPAADSAAETKPILLPPPVPLDGFPAEDFKSRRAALRQSLPDGLILIRGATEDEVPHGAPLRYRQNSAFFYLTGVDTPGAYLVLLPPGLLAVVGLRNVKAEVREIIFLPARDASAEQWTGPKLGPGDETVKLTGIDYAADTGKMWGALAAWIRRDPVVHTLVPFGETARGTKMWAMMQRITDLAPAVQFRDCSTKLAKQRAVKSPAEIVRMREAVAVSDTAHRAARAVIARGEGKHEYDVEAAVLHAYRVAGAGVAFSSIVGAGVNAAILHYEQSEAVMKTGDLIVVDIGARVGHYNGDVTRTYPVGGKFLDQRRREIYELVLGAHQQAVREFKVGDSLDAMTERCKTFFKESPLRAKDAAGEEKTMETFFPHSLGHHLGLDVHDVNDAADRQGPLPVRSIITIEPGIYLPQEGIGVRIEDDYLVTESGLESLSSGLEMDVADVERVMLSGR
jgi:Xaa-Pro aminopeptidase